MITKCPECGEQIQATVTIQHWYTLTSDGWTHYDDSEPGEMEPVRVYCANDHKIDPALVASLPVAYAELEPPTG